MFPSFGSILTEVAFLLCFPHMSSNVFFSKNGCIKTSHRSEWDEKWRDVAGCRKFLQCMSSQEKARPESVAGLIQHLKAFLKGLAIKFILSKATVLKQVSRCALLTFAHSFQLLNFFFSLFDFLKCSSNGRQVSTPSPKGSLLKVIYWVSI